MAKHPPPPTPCPLCEQMGPSERDSRGLRGLGSHVLPVTVVADQWARGFRMLPEDHRILGVRAGDPIHFRIDPRGTSSLTSQSGPPAADLLHGHGRGGAQSTCPTRPLSWWWGNHLVAPKLLVVPEGPGLVLGRDFLSALGACLSPPGLGASPGQPLSRGAPALSLQVWHPVNSHVCHEGTPAALKDKSNYPGTRQHPIKPEPRRGPQPVTDMFLALCRSPCRTPILPALEVGGEDQVAQQPGRPAACHPLHPVMPHP